MYKSTEGRQVSRCAVVVAQNCWLPSAKTWLDFETRLGWTGNLVSMRHCRFMNITAQSAHRYDRIPGRELRL